MGEDARIIAALGRLSDKVASTICKLAERVTALEQGSGLGDDVRQRLLGIISQGDQILAREAKVTRLIESALSQASAPSADGWRRTMEAQADALETVLRIERERNDKLAVRILALESGTVDLSEDRIEAEVAAIVDATQVPIIDAALEDSGDDEVARALDEVDTLVRAGLTRGIALGRGEA